MSRRQFSEPWGLHEHFRIRAVLEHEREDCIVVVVKMPLRLDWPRGLIIEFYKERLRGEFGLTGRSHNRSDISDGEDESNFKVIAFPKKRCGAQTRVVRDRATRAQQEEHQANHKPSRERSAGRYSRLQICATIAPGRRPALR